MCPFHSQIFVCNPDWEVAPTSTRVHPLIHTKWGRGREESINRNTKWLYNNTDNNNDDDNSNGNNNNDEDDDNNNNDDDDDGNNNNNDDDDDDNGNNNDDNDDNGNNNNDDDGNSESVMIRKSGAKVNLVWPGQAILERYWKQIFLQNEPKYLETFCAISRT